MLMSPGEVDLRTVLVLLCLWVRTALWQMHMHTSAHIGDVCDTPCVDLKHVRSKMLFNDHEQFGLAHALVVVIVSFICYIS